MSRRCNLDGQPIDPRDRAAIARFTLWLQGAGEPAPMPPPAPHSEVVAQEYAVRLEAWRQTRTPAQRAFIREALLDPEWRAFLGYDPLPDPTPGDAA